MIISLRLNDEDIALIKSYASMKKVSVSELIRISVMEHIEDEFDLKAYDDAMTEHKKNPFTYTLHEVEKELGLR